MKHTYLLINYEFRDNETTYLLTKYEFHDVRVKSKGSPRRTMQDGRKILSFDE